MDHTEAVRSSAAERYTLGDLPVGQVEEFERHFFECPQCSEELRTLSVLAENARVVFSEDAFRASSPREDAFQASSPREDALQASSPTVVAPEARPNPVERVRRWWKQPWALGPAFAAIAIAIFAGYQSLVVVPQLRHELNQIGQVSEFPLYAASRGEETVVAPRGGEPFYILYLDMTWEGQAQRAILRDHAGRSEPQSFDLTDHGKGTVSIRVPVRALAAGRYVLSIQGKDGAGTDKELARYPFTLRFE